MSLRNTKKEGFVNKLMMAFLFFKSRGHNVVAVDQEGSVIEAKAFDTFGDSSSGTNMANFITSLPDHTVVLIATQDSADVYVGDAADALKSLGATEPLNPGYRGSWLLVGYKGTGEKPSWVRQASKKRYFGPASVAVKVFEWRVASTQVTPSKLQRIL